MNFHLKWENDLPQFSPMQYIFPPQPNSIRDMGELCSNEFMRIFLRGNR